MNENDPLSSLRENQTKLTADRCSLEITRPSNWPHHEDQLKFVEERFLAGNPLALYDGLILCRDGELPLPQWLTEGLAAFMLEAMKNGLKGERGKGNHFLGEIRKARITQIRAHMVWAIRKVQKDRKKWLGLPSPLKEMFFSGTILDFGKTEDDAFRVASEALRSTIARGAESTMKKAHRNAWRDEHSQMNFFALYETEYVFDLRLEKRASHKIPNWINDWEAGRPIKP